MNLLVTGAFNWTEDELNKLKEAGHEVVFMQQEKDELPCEPKWVEGIIGNGLFVSHPIEQFENLHYIQLTSAGYDRVPMDYVKEKRIQINNARDVYSIPMAEFAVCGVLELYKQSKVFLDNQREQKWIKHRDVQELYGKTVCIVGCGSVGTECAKRFRAFECRVIGITKSPKACVYYQEIYNFSEIDEVINYCDVLIMTVPLTVQTRKMMDKRRFELLKSGSLLVNISRGAIIDTEALICWLQGNSGGGAVLDVFEEEPLDPSSPLWGMSNVIITPHNSFIGEGNHQRMWNVIRKNLNDISRCN